MKRSAMVMALLIAASAWAQPMMIDPSKMSGIPRPDPQVPAGTITVRLIRGELSNRMVGVAVGLAQQGGQVRIGKTDENGRATFSGLTGGPFQARATDGKEELTSQSIELPTDVGVRVMLVFKAEGGGASGGGAEGGGAPGSGGAPAGGVSAGGGGPEAGTTGGADGVARPDQAVAAGTLLVRAVGEGGAPQAGLEVVLGMARAGEGGVKERKAKTDARGEAKFEGLDAKPTSGYLAEVVREGARFSSKPFRMQENAGERVTIDVRPVSHDVSALHIGPGSHLIFEVSDDVVQVVEVWRLMNPSSSAVDPGPNGLHLALPDKALSAQAGPQNPPNFTVAGHEAVLRGPIAPGDTEMQVMFALAYDGGALDFQQRTPLAFDDVAMVTEKIEGLGVDGNQLATEERELQGRKLILYRGPGTTPGGVIDLRFHGLPHADPTWRYVAVALALVFLIGFGIHAARGSGTRATRDRLEQQREHLLNELAALQRDGADKSDAKRKHKQEELTARLVRVYRELDEVGQ